MTSILPDIRKGLVKKPPVDFRAGLVAKPAAKPEAKKEGAAKPTHPAGEVTGFDEQTGLPIVRRSATTSATPNDVKKQEIIGKEDPKTDRTVLHASNDADKIQEAAKAEHPNVKKAIRLAIQGIEGAKLHGDRDEKPEERTQEKIEEEGQPAKTIPDFSGFRVSVTSDKAHGSVADAIRKHFNVVKEKDEFKDGAPDTKFHAHMMQVQMPESKVSHEVQVLPKPVADAAEATHATYEKARGGDKDAADKMKAHNEAAWKEFQGGQSGKEGGRGESPEQTAGGSAGVLPPAALKVGDAVKLKDGRRATVAYAPSASSQLPMYRFKTADGKTVEIRKRDVMAGAAVPADPSWVGFDLDKTLSKYDGHFKGSTVIGAPVPKMVERAKQHIANGDDVRIMSARMADDKDGKVKKAIGDWTEKHIGKRLEATDRKDSKMKVLYDDRARQVVPNEGTVVGEHA